jgi:hypothetical protein
MALSAKEKKIHEQGLISVLKQIHDDLDAAVFDAYGWDKNLSDEQILEKLVTLNHERAAEEQRGLIRWLRPEFQNKPGGASIQLDLPASTKTKKTKKAKPTKIPWPKTTAEQAKAIKAVLSQQAVPASIEDLCKHFTRAKKEKVEELIETFLALGQARRVGEGYLP